ncbi:MAG TPA: hypothetical protein ENO11_04840, partial [Desulfobacteraceae bacterium]|nr:hypothetical protein [Desulfobacteraceae bacterium]
MSIQRVRAVMDEKKKSVKENLTDTMACTAFGEAGEPCPIGQDTEDKKGTKGAGKEKSAMRDVSSDMACTAFAEAGEPCPIDQGAGDK